MTALTFAYGIHAGLPFSIYGENLFMMLQNLLILVLFFPFQRRPLTLAEILSLPMTFTLAFLFLFQVVPAFYQELSIWMQLPVCIPYPYFSLCRPRIANHDELPQ